MRSETAHHYPHYNLLSCAGLLQTPQQPTNNRHATLISAYAPTLDADPECKELFYASLHSAINITPSTDKLILLGDFNARVGSDGALWKDVLGQHGVGKLNENGLRLLTLCSEYRLVITNTLFQLKNRQDLLATPLL